MSKIRTWEIEKDHGFLVRDVEKISGPNTKKIKVVALDDYISMVGEYEKTIKVIEERYRKQIDQMIEQLKQTHKNEDSDSGR